MYEVYCMCVYVHKFALNIFSKVKGEQIDFIALILWRFNVSVQVGGSFLLLTRFNNF